MPKWLWVAAIGIGVGLRETWLGDVSYLLGAAAGTAIAVFLSSSRVIQRAFYPYAVFFQTVPIIAIAPTRS